jgi:hypothetical protein
MQAYIDDVLADLVAAAWMSTVEAEELADQAISLYVLRCVERDYDPLVALRELESIYAELMGVHARDGGIAEAIRSRIALLEAATAKLGPWRKRGPHVRQRQISN